MIRVSQAIFLTAACLVVATTLSAQKPVDKKDKSYAGPWELLKGEHDKDKNGVVTAEEYKRGAERFKRLDKNKDGKLTSDDFVQEERRGRRRDRRGRMRRRGEGRGNRGQRPQAPSEGTVAPDFALKTKDGKKTVKLSQLKGKKPVALIFGSYTWPPFRRSAGRLKELYKKYGKKVQFYVVYIKEAHALDGASPNTRPGSPLVQEPITLEERLKLAQQCTTAMEIKEIPTLVDDIKDNTATSYAALPDLLFLVSKAGTLAYVGGRGPRGFKPDELDEAIQIELGLKKKIKKAPAPTSKPTSKPIQNNL